jgi:hypothetical protein
MIYWSWPVIQIVFHTGGVGLVKGFRQTIRSGVTARTDEYSSEQGRLSAAEKRAIAQQKNKPVLASTRLGRVLFVVTTVAMFCILLVFAFWGLFVY